MSYYYELVTHRCALDTVYLDFQKAFVKVFNICHFTGFFPYSKIIIIFLKEFLKCSIFKKISMVKPFSLNFLYFSFNHSFSVCI